MFQGVSAFAQRSTVHALLIMAILMVIGFSFSSFFSVLFIQVFFDLPLISDPSAFDRIYDPEHSAALKFMSVMNQIGFFGLPGLAIMWLKGLSKGQPRSSWSWIPVLLIPVCALPLVAWLGNVNESLSSVDEAFNWMKANQEKANELYEKLLVMTDSSDLMVNLLIMAFIPAIAEEVLFRGGLQQIIRKHSGRAHLAIWITAIVFSLVHFQFLTFIPRVVMGAGLGYIFYWGGSLWMPILAHMINNAIAVSAYYFLADDPRMEQFDSIGSTLDLWVIASLTTVVGLFVFLAIRSKQKTRT